LEEHIACQARNQQKQAASAALLKCQAFFDLHGLTTQKTIPTLPIVCFILVINDFRLLQ
jgi:hypothetical protein